VNLILTVDHQDPIHILKIENNSKRTNNREAHLDSNALDPDLLPRPIQVIIVNCGRELFRFWPVYFILKKKKRKEINISGG